MLILLGSIAAFLAGVVVMIKGSMLGLILLLAGFAGIVVYAALMLRAGGYRAEGAFFNGFGKGRQQPETAKQPAQNSGEQSANVWEKLEDQK